MLAFNVSILEGDMLVDSAIVSCQQRVRGQSATGPVVFTVTRKPANFSIDKSFSVKDLTIGREQQAIKTWFESGLEPTHRVEVTRRTELDDKIETEMTREMTEWAKEVDSTSGPEET